MLELADISRPVVGREFGERALVHALYRRLAAQPLHEVVDERGQVLAMFGERRGTNEKDGEAVVKIGAEGAGQGVLRERPVGCGNDADIYLDGLVVAHPLQLSALDKAQELGLQSQRHLADFVQKERTAIGGLDATGPALHGAGKGAARVAEQFRFKQRFRNCRAIDGDKRFAVSWRQPMQSFGHYLLARASGSLDQHRRKAGRNEADTAADFEHAGRVADQLGQPVAGGGSVPRALD